MGRCQKSIGFVFQVELGKLPMPLLRMHSPAMLDPLVSHAVPAISERKWAGTSARLKSLRDRSWFHSGK
jgi:hypothetical protein